MATNTYTYGALGQRWVLQTPTSKANLDISRTQTDANRWSLQALVTNPDLTAQVGAEPVAFTLTDGTKATTQPAGNNSTEVATTAYADAAAPSYQTMSLSDTFKIEVRTAADPGGQVIWSLGWFKSGSGATERWWLLGNTANVDTFTRAQAEFYIPTGDIADVPLT
jgi:hypothetical protein|tara:strand:- start:42 stop:539 length:498 start_codon:yes stop_codon:yes gene_type:complete